MPLLRSGPVWDVVDSIIVKGLPLTINKGSFIILQEVATLNGVIQASTA